MNAHAGAIMNTPLADAAHAAHAPSDERPIVAQAHAGSLDAFGKLVTRFQGGVFNYLLRRLGSRCDAEDLTQETFVRAWTSMATYDDRWRFSTWLYAIATRLAIDHARSARQRSAAGQHEWSDASALAVAKNGTLDPAAPLMEREARRNLWLVAQQMLGEEERSALWLKYAEGFSSDEIARTLGRSSIAVRVMLFRARRLLADALAERGEGDEAMIAVQEGADVP